MKSSRIILSTAAIWLAATMTPVWAASSIEVPTSPTAPSVDPRADDATFAPAAIAQLGWNSTQSRDADEETTARVSTDGKNLYVRFDATQRERIVSASVVDGRSDGDLVWIALQPSGASGATYTFAASPDGTSGAATAPSSTAPAFKASGATFDGGYTVTMAIPLSALRGAQGGAWSAQFGRSVHASGQQFVWSHDGNVAQAGTMTMPASVGITP